MKRHQALHFANILCKFDWFISLRNIAERTIIKTCIRMKNLSLKWMAVLAAGFFGFASCNTEDVKPNVPQISVEGGNVVYVSSTGGQFQVDVKSNRDWTVTIPDDAGWLLADPKSGSGDGTITFDYGPNSYIQQETVVKIATSTVYVNLLVIQQGQVASSVLLYESMGTATVSANTPVSSFTSWLKAGTGAQNVTYTGTSNMSIRTTMNSAGAYPDASGGNDLFFGGGTNSFTITGIATGDHPQAIISFGCSRAGSDGSSYAPFVNDDLVLTYQANGGAETPVGYQREDPNGWGVATATIDLPAGTTSLNLKFTSTASSVIRVDDIKVVGLGGSQTTTPVVRTGAVENPTPTGADVSALYIYEFPSPAVTVFGIMWKEAAAASYPAANVKNSTTPDNPSFKTTLTGLTTGTAYVYRGYVTTSDGQSYYGEEVQYTPQPSLGATIWNENVGGTAVTATTKIANFNAWGKTGPGSSGVTYAGSAGENATSGTDGITIRSSAPVSTGCYTDASGGNCIFFGTNTAGNDVTEFTATGITFSGQDNVTLTFGASKSQFVTGTGNVQDYFKYSEFKLFYSFDNGATWTQSYFTRDVLPDPTKTYGYCRAVIPSAGRTGIALKWESNEPSVYRLDDMILSQGGTPITLPAAPFVYSGATVTDRTATTATVSGNSFYYPAGTPTEVGVQYRRKGTQDTFTRVAASSVTEFFSVTLTGLAAETEYEYQAYATVGATTTADQVQSMSFTTTMADNRYAWTTTVGTQEVSGNTTLAAFNALTPPAGWDTGGTGSVNVLYANEGYTSDIRKTGISSGYENASGGNNIFFGALQNGVSRFLVNNVNVNGLSGNATLRFGATNNGTFASSNLKLYYSQDGTAWTEATYTYTKGSGNWGYCNVAIPVPGTRLHLKWEATVASLCRIDDMSLVTASGEVVGAAADPAVATAAASGVADVAATLNGSYSGPGTVTETGFMYKTTGANEYTKVVAAGTASPFTAALSSLAASTTYMYRAYAKTSTGVTYGPEMTFATTAPAVLTFGTPVLNKTYVVGVTTTDATITVPYTNAAGGETYTVTCSASGDGAGSGASAFPAIPDTPVTLTAGNSSFVITLPDYTPSVAGTLTFTIGGITGVTIAPVNTTVTSGGSPGDVTLASLILPSSTAAFTAFDTGSTPATASLTKSGSTTTITSATNRSAYSGNFNAANSYWVFAIPVTAEVKGNIEFGFGAYGTSTAPASWSMEYSNDGSTWNPCGTACDFTITTTTTDRFTKTFTVTEANKVAASGTLYIKVLPKTVLPTIRGTDTSETTATGNFRFATLDSAPITVIMKGN